MLAASGNNGPLWHPCAAVVLAPEGVDSASLLHTLAAHGKLIGVVVDDCHAILDTGDEFRPAFAKLGVNLHAATRKSPHAVAIVGLTGTLAVRDELRLSAALWPNAASAVDTIRVGRSIGDNLWYRVVCVGRGASMDDALVAGLCSPSLAMGRLSDTIVFVLSHDEMMRVVRMLEQSEAVRAVFSPTVYGISRTLVEESVALGTPLDERVLASMSTVLGADGRPRVLVSTPKFESGISLPGVGKVIILRASYGLSTGLQQMGRAGRGGQPDAEAMLMCEAQAAGKRSGAHNAKKTNNLLTELRDVFVGRTCIVQ